MNTIQKMLIGATIVLVPFLGSCKKDAVSCNYVTEVKQQSDALNTAAQVYTADPTNAVKCCQMQCI